MKVEDFYNESEYSKIDFGSNPTLFSKKELLDFAKEYVEAINYSQCCKSDSEQLFCYSCQAWTSHNHINENNVRCLMCDTNKAK